MVQNSENSQYPNASKCFQIAKTVQNSENSKLVSGTLSYVTTYFHFFGCEMEVGVLHTEYSRVSVDVVYQVE
jgi:hypothetical protein